MHVVNVSFAITRLLHLHRARGAWSLGNFRQHGDRITYYIISSSTLNDDDDG